MKFGSGIFYRQFKNFRLLLTVRLMLAIILYNILCLNRNFISVKGAKLLRGNPRPTYAKTVTGAFIY